MHHQNYHVTELLGGAVHPVIAATKLFLTKNRNKQALLTKMHLQPKKRTKKKCPTGCKYPGLQGLSHCQTSVQLYVRDLRIKLVITFGAK